MSKHKADRFIEGALVDARVRSKPVEETLLGALLLMGDKPSGQDRESFEEAVAALEPDDFASTRLAYIFERMKELSQKGPVDPIVVYDEIARRGETELATLGDILKLTESLPRSANLRFYADRVREHRAVRDVVRGAAEAIEGSLAHDPLPDIRAKLSGLVERIQTGPKPVEMRSLIASGLEEMERRRIGEKSPGLATGFRNHDRLTAGLQIGDLSILAGRPGTGKTSLALGKAIGLASRGSRGLFLSLEMPAVQVAFRLISMMSQVPLHLVRTGRVSDAEAELIIDAAERLGSLPLLVDDRSQITPAELRGLIVQSRRMLQGLDFVIIDHMSYCHSPDAKAEEYAQISSIVRELKMIAKDSAVAVLALHQLNRGTESRTNTRPRLSDLRSSGKTEEDAATVLGVWRPNEDTKEEAELIILKQRNGPKSTIPMFFDGDTTTWSEKETGFDR